MRRACAILILGLLPATLPTRGAAAVGPEAIGVAVPTLVRGYDPGRRWVALCQAREDTDGDGRLAVTVGFHGETRGDALRPYLVIGAGAGRRIDAFVDATSDGRLVAFVEGGRLVLWDSATNAHVDLTARGATLPADAHAGAPGPGGFDPSGERFLYYRGDGPHRRAVVRDLASGVEREVDHGLGNLYRAALADGGEHVFVWTYPVGAALKLPRTTLSPDGCRGPVTVASGGGWSILSRELVRVDGGPFAATDALAIVVGELLARTASGKLVWEVAGHSAPALPRGVHGQVLGVGASGGLVVAAAVADGRSEIRWIGPGRSQVRTGWLRAPPTQDWITVSPRVWSAWPDEGGTWLVDLDTGAHMVLDGQPQSPGAWEDRALFLGEGRVTVAEIGRRRVTRLALPVRPYAPAMVQGRWAVATVEGPAAVVLDLARADVVGYVSGAAPEGLSDDGRVLVPSVAAPRDGLATGPLRWRRPSPQAPSSATSSSHGP